MFLEKKNILKIQFHLNLLVIYRFKSIFSFIINFFFKENSNLFNTFHEFEVLMLMNIQQVASTPSRLGGWSVFQKKYKIANNFFIILKL